MTIFNPHNNNKIIKNNEVIKSCNLNITTAQNHHCIRK